MPQVAHALINLIPAAVLRYDRSHLVRYANEAAARLFGRPTAELDGVSADDLITPADARAAHQAAVERVFDTGEPTEYEGWATVPAGAVWLHNQLTPELDDDGQVASVVSVTTDLTRLRSVEGGLRRSERRFQAFLDHTPAVAWTKGPDGRYRYVNRTWRHRFGEGGPSVGLTDAELWPADVATELAVNDRRVLASGEPLEAVEHVPTPDGVLRPWLVVKFPLTEDDGSVSTGGMALDLSELRRLEAEKARTEKRLYEALKLESLGVLAGGIAHDFNNLLTSILGFTSLAQLDLAGGRTPAALDHLRHVELASGRAAELCKQMLAYAGKGRFLVTTVSLTTLVEEMAQLLQAAISKKAVLRYILARDLPPVTCDATQLRQVVMNLITNASDAIGDRSGVITVSTGAIDADAKYLAELSATELPPAKYVYAEVSDTGCGMDDATKARIFEPFFTTKFTGRGLGLAAVQGIVRAHGGAIKVYTAVGRGTTVKVLLPASRSAVDAEPPTAPPSPTGGGRVVLVVDDEEDIRVFARKALEAAGFRVLVAADGREALAVHDRNAADVALVVCDLTMPHLDGAATFRQLRNRAPAVKVILTSGFSEDEATTGLAGMRLTGFLRKPFRVSDLLQAINAALAPVPPAT